MKVNVVWTELLTANNIFISNTAEQSQNVEIWKCTLHSTERLIKPIGFIIFKCNWLITMVLLSTF